MNCPICDEPFDVCKCCYDSPAKVYTAADLAAVEKDLAAAREWYSKSSQNFEYNQKLVHELEAKCATMGEVVKYALDWRRFKSGHDWQPVADKLLCKAVDEYLDAERRAKGE